MWHIIQPNGHYQGHITVIPPKRQVLSFQTIFVDDLGTAIYIQRKTVSIVYEDGQATIKTKALPHPCLMSSAGVIDAFRNNQMLASHNVIKARLHAVARQGQSLFELPFNN